jgi:hypothetical protein
MTRNSFGKIYWIVFCFPCVGGCVVDCEVGKLVAGFVCATDDDDFGLRWGKD